jgi:hypothetical protein
VTGTCAIIGTQMARSLDKAAWSGKEPLCALCLSPTRERRRQLHLSHGVAVWLCPAHGSPEFQRRVAPVKVVSKGMVNDVILR